MNLIFSKKILRKLFFVPLILSLFLLGQQNSQAQNIKVFSSDSVKFIKEISRFLSKGGHKKDMKKIMEEFTPYWTFSLNKAKRAGLVSVINDLQLKRAVAYPHIKDYMLTMVEFEKKKIDETDYKEWKRILNNLITNKKMAIKHIEDFLETSFNLYTSNIIYKSPTTEWKSNNANFKFRFDPEHICTIIFQDINLVCFAKNSGSVIYGTSGKYYLFDRTHKFEGVNGQVTWERAGFEKEEIYAMLNKYDINLSKSEYDADSVALFYKKYFEKPLYGKLVERIAPDVTTPDKAVFPKFNSYTKRFKIPKIYEGIDYEGGFSMEGAKFIGFGNSQEPAFLYIYKKDSIFLTASSKAFVFKKDLCISRNTTIKFKLDTDSIYHPSIMFKYFVDKKRVELIRDGEGLSKSPFINSFHKVDMEVEVISWQTDEPKMDLKMTRTLSGEYNTVFQSSNLFDLYVWDKIALNDNLHPLLALKQYADQIDSREFTADAFINNYGFSNAQATQMLLGLAFYNIISFDFDSRTIKLNDRLYDYINSRGKKIDYDVIKFNSSVLHKENAKINLLNFDMRIYGIRQIQLSDSQNVIVYPQPNEIVLKRNRYFEFDGKIRAGRFQFYGKTFAFDYDPFKLSLANCDSMHILAKAEDKIDEYGRQLYVVVRSTVENIRGDLFIDGPNNKSGNQKMPQYPTFKCEKNSYVFYDRKSIQGGTYKRDKFYFQIFPYTVDSLDNFENKNLRFKGHFVSGGILPEFDETLVLQPDYSLGFTKKSPEEGFPMYGGKGVFHNDINLSNKGLHGEGDFVYLQSRTTSKDFSFYPDSMNTYAEVFKNKRTPGNPEYPDVMGKNIYEHWEPYNDKLFVTDRGTPINMYEKQAYHHGTLKLEPTGMTGWGKMDIESSNLSSKLFYFKENIIDSDTAAFELKSMDLGDLAFKTNNVNAHVDFNKRMGAFKSNGEASFVEFPKNQYICFMDQINWYMDKSEIEMAVDTKKTQQQADNNLSPTQQEDVQIEGPKFISTHPKQDSLSFISPKARYSLIKSIITAYDVKYIKVADGTVYPSEKPIIIEKKAVIKPIENAKIVANNTTRYHTIYNATVNVLGKKSFTAKGDYDYVDENGKKQKIHFKEVAVDTTIQTYANGVIIEPDSFTLSPFFKYQGDVSMYASKEFLTFTGAAKIKHECERMGLTWFKFSAEVNPKEIYIPVSSNPVSINNANLAASVMIPVKADSIKLYTAFLSKPRSNSDLPILSADGFLFYDKDESKYKISNKEKLVELNMPGNYLHVHRTICNVYGEGKLNFGTEFGQLKTNPIGVITQDYETGETNIEAIMPLKFFFNESSLKKMADIINEATGLTGVDLGSKTYSKGMRELIGVEKADKWLSQVALGNLKKYPEELEEFFMLTDVKLKWNVATKSYRSYDKIGVGTILKKQINKYLDGYIEVEKKKSGDVFTMYLQLDETTWFFFTYKNGLMAGLSTDRDFNLAISESKKDKLVLEVKKGETPYRYYLATEGQKKKFVKKFEDAGAGIKSEDEEEDTGKKKKKKKEDEE